MSERGLFVLQRVSALILAPMVLVHLGLILIAVRNGLSAEEILGRTRGSVGWALFYGAFVLAASVHAPIGLRNILNEWSALPRVVVGPLTAAFGVVLLLIGMRAVYAVIGGGA